MFAFGSWRLSFFQLSFLSYMVCELLPQPWASTVAQMVRNLPAVHKTLVRSSHPCVCVCVCVVCVCVHFPSEEEARCAARRLVSVTIRAGSQRLPWVPPLSGFKLHQVFLPKPPCLCNLYVYVRCSVVSNSLQPHVL